MDFARTEDSAPFVTCRDCCPAEIDPNVDEIDEPQQFPREIVRKAADLGFLGILFPGGVRRRRARLHRIRAVVVKRSRAVDPSVGMSLAAHNSLGSNHIYTFGSAESAAPASSRPSSPRASGSAPGA